MLDHLNIQYFYPLPVKHPAKKFFKKFLLHQKLRLEISGGPLRVKTSILAHLVVGNTEKHTFGQNCPKYDATVNYFHGAKRKMNYPFTNSQIVVLSIRKKFMSQYNDSLASHLSNQFGVETQLRARLLL